MATIQDSDYPLVYRACKLQDTPSPSSYRRVAVRTFTRALAGMQKEAIVHYGPSGAVWRVVCDEGPWLNGTDLAPFPLGFFSAGLVASYMSEFIFHARQRDIDIDSLTLVVDNVYAMEGSLLRGTMVGNALPARVDFKVRANAPTLRLQELAYLAAASSPADAYLRDAHSSVFSLNHNGRAIPTVRVVGSASAQPADPGPLFGAVRPLDHDAFPQLLAKLDGVTELGGDRLGTENSAAVGLQDEQKRQVHVRGVGTLRADGMKSIDVACFQPIGSVFRLLSDDSTLCGGEERAPSGLAYLAAGISFCFMTQLGRYASVAKQKLNSYRVVQDTLFDLPAAVSDGVDRPRGAPVDTHVFIGSDEEAAASQTLVAMGEQTCYLHAACRSSTKTRVHCTPSGSGA